MIDFDTPVACIDIESTGLSPSKDRVIEIAVLRIEGDTLTPYETLINPERDPGPTFAHGLTTEDLIDAPLFWDIAPELSGMLDGAVIAAHNVNFDSSFLRYEFWRLGKVFPQHPLLDTVRAGWALGRVVSGDSRKLADLCAREGIDATGPHTAAWDAGLVALLVQAYLARAKAYGLGYADLAISHLELPQPLKWPELGKSKAKPRSV